MAIIIKTMEEASVGQDDMELTDREVASWIQRNMSTSGAGGVPGG